MSYLCEWCGAEFEEPHFTTRMENLDGENGWWKHTAATCPFCGSDEFAESVRIEEDESA